MIVCLIPLALRLQFRRGAASDAHGVVELRLRDPRGGHDAVEVTLDNGRCLVQRRPSERPTATLSVGLADMIRMATGAVGVPALLQGGRLQVNGDLFLIMRFPTFFGMPTRPLV